MLETMLTADYGRQFLAQGWHVLLFPGIALICFGLSIGSLVILLRKRAALPRLRQIIGRVNLMETVDTTDTGSVVRETAQVVNVTFFVDGTEYRCRRLYLFHSGNRVGGNAPPLNLSAGTAVMVHYDPQNPKISALLVDKPRIFSVIWFLVIGLGFLFFTPVPVPAGYVPPAG